MDTMMDTMLTIVFIFFIIIVFTLMVVNLQAEELCLEHGWKDAKITWDLTAYCIREENEYEIVKPLKVILEEMSDG